MTDIVNVGGWQNGLTFGSFFPAAGNYAANLLLHIPFKYEESNAPVLRPAGYSELVNKAIAAVDDKTKIARSKEMVKMLHDEAILNPMWAGKVFGAKQKYANDSDIGTYNILEWKPENAWLDK